MIKTLTALGLLCALLFVRTVHADSGGNFVFRYRPSGSADFGFGTSGLVTGRSSSQDQTLAAVAPSPFGDGTILGGGEFGPSGGHHNLIVGRYKANGQTDTSFGFLGVTTTASSTTADEHVRFIGFQSSFKILVAGESFDQGHGSWFVARFNWDGSVDTTFGSNGMAFVFDGPVTLGGMKVQIDDTILLTGSLDEGYAFAKLTASGALDRSFGSRGTFVPAKTARGFRFGEGRGVAVDTRGRILTGCNCDSGDNPWVIRLTSAGALDTSYGDGGFAVGGFAKRRGWVEDIAIDSSDRVVATGTIQSTAGGQPYDVGIARFTTGGGVDGTLPPQFITFKNPTLTKLESSRIRIQQNGMIVVLATGLATTTSKFAIALTRITPTGAWDTFGTSGRTETTVSSGSFFPSSLAVLPDGSGIVGGRFF